MDPRLIVSREDLKCWKLLERIDKATLELIKFFKPHQDRLYAVLNDGRLIAAGDNKKGLLGLGNRQEVETFGEIRKLRGMPIKDIQCGPRNVMVLTEDGQVWGWGWNDFGQVGLGDHIDHLVPRRILNSGIIEVKCGAYFTLALKKNGKLLTWGRNEYGQLGNGTMREQLTPIPVVSLENVAIGMIATGTAHSIAITREGKAYGWGRNDDFQLGQGHHNNVLRPVPISVYNTTITAVACSGFCTFFRTNEGQGFVNSKNEGKFRLFEIESGIHIERIAIANYFLACELSPAMFLAVWAGGKLYYFANTKQNKSAVNIIPTDLSLSQIISHCQHQMFPELLYMKPQGVETKKRDSGFILNEEFFQNVTKFFDSPRLSDIEFVFPDEQSIKAHRAFLTVASEHLCTELSTTYQSLDRVPISAYPYSVFYQYLSYLYMRPLVSDDINQIMSLVKLAHDYRELSLIMYCVGLLIDELNICTCCQLYELAVDLQLAELEEKACEMILCEMASVKNSKGFKKLSVENVTRLFKQIPMFIGDY